MYVYIYVEGNLADLVVRGELINQLVHSDYYEPSLRPQSETFLLFLFLFFI